MKKKEKYEHLYGDIPKEEDARMNFLLSQLNFKKQEIPFIHTMKNLLMHIPKKKEAFTLFLVPEPTPRPRFSSKTHSFYVKGARDNFELFQEILDELDEIPVICTASSLKLTSYLPTPKAMNRFEKYFAELGLIKPISIPDWDNLAKTYSDMIQKNLILNDSIIWQGISTKRYSIKPRIELEIEYDLAYDCSFNRKKIEASRYYRETDSSRFIRDLETVLELMKKGGSS